MLKRQIRAKFESAVVTKGDARVTVMVHRPGGGKSPVVSVRAGGDGAEVVRDPEGGWYEVRHPAGSFRFWLESPDWKSNRPGYWTLVIAADRAWRIAWEAGEPEAAAGAKTP